MDAEKTQGEQLKDRLFLKRDNLFKNYYEEHKTQIEEFADSYIDFMSRCKTEREVTVFAKSLFDKNGFSEFVFGKEYKPGDKIYYINKKKSVIALVVGEEPIEDGVNIIAAHIDSPRLDLKPNPLYEANEIAYFKTHYYGGIKKYQWVTIPLALHGVVALSDGSVVDVVVGEDENDPVFCISDILPHLAYKVQNNRTTKEVIRGEELNVILGTEPYQDEKISEAVKLNILAILNEKYGITEADFVSAEFEIVPAFKARYIGFDKSLIGAYGHDDRVCAYASFMALVREDRPKKTSVCVLADKEEIGSEGNTGLNSDLLRNFFSLFAKTMNANYEAVVMNSKALSADVNAAYDPNFAEVNEKNNCCYLNKGPVLTKYTGSGGKSGTNDCSAEFVSQIRRLFDENNIPWQTGQLGKVDEGGGGTVAKHISYLGIDVIDIGVGLFSMHSPYEIASRADIYAMYESFCIFYR